MLTLGDIINELNEVKKLIDSVEVKGYENMHLMMVAYERCSALVTVITQTVQELQNAGNNQSTEG